MSSAIPIVYAAATSQSSKPLDQHGYTFANIQAKLSPSNSLTHTIYVDSQTNSSVINASYLATHAPTATIRSYKNSVFCSTINAHVHNYVKLPLYIPGTVDHTVNRESVMAVIEVEFLVIPNFAFEMTLGRRQLSQYDVVLQAEWERMLIPSCFDERSMSVEVDMWVLNFQTWEEREKRLEELDAMA